MNRTQRAVYNRRDKLKRRYGITVEEYDAMFIDQNGACAICERPCPTRRRLAVDHDHKTKEVRGLLCADCNFGIGKFRDSPELLQRAAAYLKRKHPRNRK